MTASKSSKDIAYCLRYAYTCWLREGLIADVVPSIFRRTEELLAGKELRVLRTRYVDKQIQLLVSAKPDQSAVEIAGCAKRMLSFAFSQLSVSASMLRKFSLRSVGENTSRDLEHYLLEQVNRRGYLDDRFSESLSRYTKRYVHDMSQSVTTTHGRYWNDIHLVITSNDQYCVSHSKVWDELVTSSERWTKEQGHFLNSMSLLPDHIHYLIRPALRVSPYEVGSGLIERLNALRSMPNIYRPKFYVGTYGAYSMSAIRNKGSS
jgi:REP element-mobilizing transposase RayT